MANLTNVNAVLFDLDGTLLDTALDLGGAANRLVTTTQHPLLDDETMYQMASQGALALIKARFGHELTAVEYQELRRQFLAIYSAHINDATCYFASVTSLLDMLDHHNIRWGIVTNKPRLYTQQLLRFYPRLAHCDVIICGDTLRVSKPDPAPLLLAAQKLGIAPQHIVYVGDARTDIQAASSAGMISVAANYGYIPIDDPSHLWRSDYVIDQAQDLIEVLALNNSL